MKVNGELAFGVRLAADPTRAGRVYATWLQAEEVGVLRFANVGNPIMATRSDDGGATWMPPVRVSGASRERVVGSSPVVGQDGTLYVLYNDLGQDRLDYEAGHEGRGGAPFTGPSSLVLARSEDGGATWSESVAAPASSRSSASWCSWRTSRRSRWTATVACTRPSTPTASAIRT